MSNWLSLSKSKFPFTKSCFSVIMSEISRSLEIFIFFLYIEVIRLCGFDLDYFLFHCLFLSCFFLCLQDRNGLSVILQSSFGFNQNIYQNCAYCVIWTVSAVLLEAVCNIYPSINFLQSHPLTLHVLYSKWSPSV